MKTEVVYVRKRLGTDDVFEMKTVDVDRGKINLWLVFGQTVAVEECCDEVDIPFADDVTAADAEVAVSSSGHVQNP